MGCQFVVSDNGSEVGFRDFILQRALHQHGADIQPRDGVGVRRPGGQAKEDPHGAHPAICKGRDRRLDGRGRFTGGALVSARAALRRPCLDPEEQIIDTAVL